jgi:hypothetical protein
LKRQHCPQGVFYLDVSVGITVGFSMIRIALAATELAGIKKGMVI